MFADNNRNATSFDEVLDLTRFLASYTEARGFPPYHPRWMLKLLVYGYTTGIRSSRKIETHCHSQPVADWSSKAPIHHCDTQTGDPAGPRLTGHHSTCSSKFLRRQTGN